MNLVVPLVKSVSAREVVGKIESQKKFSTPSYVEWIFLFKN